ncbi:tRNA (N(6)-L-threonylcarbamoyladenosine(37)-C(2))-methylthiotransferase [Candidatus Bathyarchaeota archaeon]|nr:tRNA (N(6)-L-threonylcarbamoyladenosine(37)-C(2))-methylthiotransferase [Candidatus Bathyarchaeota archaeon]
MIGRIYAEGYGCPSNDYDLELMLSRFEFYGYIRAPDFAEADLVIVNTCAVKKRTEDRVLSRLKFFEKMDKRVVVAGCLPVVNLDAVVKAVPSYAALLSPFSVERIDEVLEHKFQLRGENLMKGSRKPKAGTVAPKIGSVIETIPICEGCFGECSFCCTRMARGRLLSCSPDSILNSVELGLACGVKEFWLTGQDIGAYGRDINWDLAGLLRSVSSLDGEFMVRLGMLNPEWCLERLEELVDIFKSPKVFRFLHLPLQSGNNEVLRSMKRRYTVQDFMMVIKELKKKCPDITLWTDIICGYPTESEKCFVDTLHVLKDVQFDVVNVSKFSSRPGTSAQRLKPIPSEVVKDRSLRASHIWKDIALLRNKGWIGWSGEVLIDEVGKNRTWIGRTNSYKPVAFADQEVLLGRKVHVKIIEAQPTHLVGRLVG